MTYNKDTTIGDATTSEYYEGTPEEIAKLIYLKENGLIENNVSSVICEETSINDVAEEIAKQMGRKTRMGAII